MHISTYACVNGFDAFLVWLLNVYLRIDVALWCSSLILFHSGKGGEGSVQSQILFILGLCCSFISRFFLTSSKLETLLVVFSCLPKQLMNWRRLGKRSEQGERWSRSRVSL